ncbi:OLC1v1037112C1 [Oldenlandia corymbosa var. corymbosa]|uniref:OLC1v1037112C1 n=1 Tax=Oldenlandia corymbosa var. corymbosa TaxID=529605 RepID=A0AAV1D062_OLDCO|nr:OLC1v1037112C1 [Oldenlandia corymbosa var. corymbosa]
MSCDYIFKFITVGDSAVGKSCLSYRFTDRIFPGGHDPTIGAGFFCRTITINRKKVKLHIWDTSGQERFRSITRSYYRAVSGALLVYDISRRETFDNVVFWLKEVRQHVHPDTNIMLVGNKSDLDPHKREVTTEEGSRLAGDHGLMFLECSARTGQNVEAAFVQTAKAVLERIQPIESDVEELKHRGIRAFPFHGRRLASIYVTPLITTINRKSSCCFSS